MLKLRVLFIYRSQKIVLWYVMSSKYLAITDACVMCDEYSLDATAYHFASK